MFGDDCQSFVGILYKCNIGVIIGNILGIDWGICGDFRDKRLIQYFSRCDVFINTPHSKNISSKRFSSKIPRKFVRDGRGLGFGLDIS